MAFMSLNKKNALVLLVMLSVCMARSVAAFSVKITKPADQQILTTPINILVEMFINKNNKNPSYYEINNMFENADSVVPNEMLKVIAWQESNWQQFIGDDSNVYACPNYKMNENKEKILDPKTKQPVVNSTDYGIMQINNQSSGLEDDEIQWDFEKIKKDIEYNIRAGSRVLEKKKQWIERVKKRKPQKWKEWVRDYDLAGHSDTEIILKAYNGFQKSWVYLEGIEKSRKEKLWARDVDVSLMVDQSHKKSVTIKRTDQFKYYWDITKEEEGKRRISVNAKTENCNYADKIDVQVKKEDEKKEKPKETTQKMNRKTKHYVFEVEDQSETFSSFANPPVIHIFFPVGKIKALLSEKVGVAPNSYSLLVDGGTESRKEDYGPKKFVQATLSLDAVSPVPTYYNVKIEGGSADWPYGYVENISEYHYEGVMTDYQKLWANGLVMSHVSVGSCPPHTDPPYTYSVRNIKLVIELAE